MRNFYEQLEILFDLRMAVNSLTTLFFLTLILTAFLLKQRQNRYTILMPKESVASLFRRFVSPLFVFLVVISVGLLYLSPLTFVDYFAGARANGREFPIAFSILAMGACLAVVNWLTQTLLFFLSATPETKARTLWQEPLTLIFVYSALVPFLCIWFLLKATDRKYGAANLSAKFDALFSSVHKNALEAPLQPILSSLALIYVYYFAALFSLNSTALGVDGLQFVHIQKSLMAVGVVLIPTTGSLAGQAIAFASYSQRYVKAYVGNKFPLATIHTNAGG